MDDIIPATGTTAVPANTASRASILPVAMPPVHLVLMPFPIVCFIGTLVTDLAYWSTADMMWADFSAWLLFAGLVMGGIAALAGLVNFIRNRSVRSLAPSLYHAVGSVIVLLLALVNAFVHSRDAWTSVVPTGLMLSAATVGVMLVTGWLGWTMVYRQHVGVAG